MRTLAPPSSVPELDSLEEGFIRPWIDHVHEYAGAFLHPSDNMPQYGREIAVRVGHGALMLQLDFDQLPSKPSKERLLIGFVQLGIDLAGIADNGGSWPPNGGHQMGRKWPILFAGVLLDDPHMKSVGQWNTLFQEDAQTFVVEETSPGEFNNGNGGYLAQDLGLPEWGIRHATQPSQDNRSWDASYRSINALSYPGFVLAAHLMGQRDAWNHEPLFDYVDRAVTVGRPEYPPSHQHYGYYTFGGDFVKDLWLQHREAQGCVWRPLDASDFYSNGAQDCL